MNYFKLDAAGAVVEIADGMPGSLGVDDWARKIDGAWGAGWCNRNDFTADLAAAVAISASAYSGDVWLVSDRGESCSPRFDVIKAPKVGEDASMAFNGDAYPVGKIAKIGKDYASVLVEGARGKIRFYRKAGRAAWVSKGFSLIPGTVDRMNPEF